MAKCWFCQNEISHTELTLFSDEFDCELHFSCFLEEIEKYQKKDEPQEIEIFMREFDYILINKDKL